ncbi:MULTISPECIES: major capsid protein [unclassified Pseudomonas]|uniref:major capsid protein n=1 Tax=unclassified Pseudomonas TaxID=196821 RepID=UPI000C14C0D3|nr:MULTISPECIES: major capsid protein [unclassified Pseudomonas]AZF64179.1 Phage protein [Pseudomonas sp. LBUM920]MCF5228538.1 major capsid protein [Pseudomonas sp. PA-5-4H]MCF5236189.1 major capsid protein [Pseudomonas sp. PA-5-4G]MCF5247397.1 major capsid protein [Pseudomonas sp. PA-5-4B]MCF5253547.1 major capsid protein [Pseudomonas sp. PA-5-4B]
MADIAIFEDDAFSVSSLTAAINDQEYLPGRISSLGLFREEGISTLTVQIEKDGDTLALVPAGERGTSGLVVGGTKRQLIPFNTVHLPERFTIKADEIQGIRAFGTRSELQAVQDVVNKRLAKARRQLDATHEFQRMGALNGQVLDADGKTVLLDIYKSFGVNRQKLQMGLNSPDTELRVKCGEALDMQEEALGSVTSSGSRAMCGKNFWNKLIVHKSVKETYLNTMQAASLRGDARESFEFGGIVWERYRGKVAGVAFVHDDKALLIPEGVPDLYISSFAPADYMETVNTQGIPYYSKIEPLPFNKGVAGEAQSNPLHLCTRPRAQILLEM